MRESNPVKTAYPLKGEVCLPSMPGSCAEEMHQSFQARGNPGSKSPCHHVAPSHLVSPPRRRGVMLQTAISHSSFRNLRSLDGVGVRTPPPSRFPFDLALSSRRPAPGAPLGYRRLAFQAAASTRVSQSDLNQSRTASPEAGQMKKEKEKPTHRIRGVCGLNSLALEEEPHGGR